MILIRIDLISPSRTPLFSVRLLGQVDCRIRSQRSHRSRITRVNACPAPRSNSVSGQRTPSVPSPRSSSASFCPLNRNMRKPNPILDSFVIRSIKQTIKQLGIFRSSNPFSVRSIISCTFLLPKTLRRSKFPITNQSRIA